MSSDEYIDEYVIEYGNPYQAVTTVEIRYLTWKREGLPDREFYLPPGSLVTVWGEPRDKSVYSGRDIRWCNFLVAGVPFGCGITPDQYELE